MEGSACNIYKAPTVLRICLDNDFEGMCC